MKDPFVQVVYIMKKMILAYNFNDDRLSMLKKAAAPLKLIVMPVQKSDRYKKIGELIGKEGYSSEDNGEALDFEDEMIVMSGFNSADIDMLLMSMRKHGMGRIALKAVVTAANIDWNSYNLYRAVKEDHEAMTKNRG